MTMLDDLRTIPGRSADFPPAGPPGSGQTSASAPVAWWARRSTRRLSIAALLIGTAFAYLWGLDKNGWANSYYSAAVQAGATDWKAFLFGSFDASNAITVDKPPASLWLMELSARLFGLNTWSILVPQALLGVASVGTLFAAVRRVSGHGAGLLAGAVLALTPVAVLMFRFNNPDALLVFLLTAATYAVVRALEKGSTRWLLLAGSLVGFGVLTKMLQAALVLPAFALVYLVAAPTPVRRRLLQLLGALAAVIVSAGWWMALVELWPAASRPYIGGSQTNSILELLLGYNGLGRITGNETGSVVGSTATATTGSQWGETGLTRLFNSTYGGQASWLIPAALVLLIGVLAVTWRRTRTDAVRSSTLLWAGWLLVTGLVISLSQGIIHEYYTVALAPAIAALVGIGGIELWRARGSLLARITLATALAVTAIWAFVLLSRTSEWLPWLRLPVLIIGLGTAIALLVPTTGRLRRISGVIAVAAILTGLAGPVAYASATITTAETGSIVTAGPAQARGTGGPGGAPGGGAGGGAAFGGTRPTGTGPTGTGTGGGFLDASTPTAALTTLLAANASSYTWTVATVTAMQAASYQLAINSSVLAIGGFNGSDPAPSLTQFQSWVSQGKIHYFIAGGADGQQQGGSNVGTLITTWVEAHFTSTTVGGTTVYDLTSPSGSTATGTSTGS